MGGERGASPNHKYPFEVSDDWEQTGKLSIWPDDLAAGDPVKDAERFARKARGVVEEFLRLEREGY